jgi:hypothetical protein
LFFFFFFAAFFGLLLTKQNISATLATTATRELALNRQITHHSDLLLQIKNLITQFIGDTSFIFKSRNDIEKGMFRSDREHKNACIIVGADTVEHIFEHAGGSDPLAN